jgi:hypothetical protein
MPEKKSFLVDSAMILALVLIGVIGYKLSPLLMPKADLSILPEAGCNLEKSSCSAALPDGGRIHLSLSPSPIPVSSPLDMTVEVSGLEADKVEIDFAGVSMNMGFNRPILAAAGPGRFAGRTTLPVCVTGRMEWQATVLVESGSRRIAVPFRFEAGH